MRGVREESWKVPQKNRNSKPKQSNHRAQTLYHQTFVYHWFCQGPPSRDLGSPVLLLSWSITHSFPQFSCSSTEVKTSSAMPQLQAEPSPMEPGIEFQSLRVVVDFKGSWPRAAQAGVLPRATNRRKLSSWIIVSFETIRKGSIA